MIMGADGAGQEISHTRVYNLLGVVLPPPTQIKSIGCWKQRYRHWQLYNMGPARS